MRLLATTPVQSEVWTGDVKLRTSDAIGIAGRWTSAERSGIESSSKLGATKCYEAPGFEPSPPRPVQVLKLEPQEGSRPSAGQRNATFLERPPSGARRQRISWPRPCEQEFKTESGPRPPDVQRPVTGSELHLFNASCCMTCDRHRPRRPWLRRGTPGSSPKRALRWRVPRALETPAQSRFAG